MNIDPRVVPAADAASSGAADAASTPLLRLQPARLAAPGRQARATPVPHAAPGRPGAAARLSPQLFAGGRPCAILEDVLVRILPALEMDGEARVIAVALLREEIDTRQGLDLRRLQADGREATAALPHAEPSP